MKFLNRIETTTFLVEKPSFPDFLEAYDPIINAPEVGDFKGSYRPKTGEVTIQHKDKVYKGILENERLTISLRTSYKGETEFYLRHVVLDSEILFKAFMKQDAQVKSGLSIAQQLMICIPDYSGQIDGYMIYPGLDKIKEGLTDLDGQLLVRKDDEYIIITQGYFLRMTRDNELGFSRYAVTQGVMLRDDETTYHECYKVGRALSQL